MAAIKMEELERLEDQYNLEPDGLTYQHRCSRITAYMNGTGDQWVAPEKPEQKKSANPTLSRFQNHPLYGKRILITPMMVPDAKRNLAFDEPLGPEIVVEDYNAGEEIFGHDDVQRMTGSYKIKHVDTTRQVVAKTTFPKIGTELSMKLGTDLVPVVRGNNGHRGYIWTFPTCVVQVEDTLIQLYGLKTLIRSVYPELLDKFQGKPVMEWIDGVSLAADITQTHKLLKEQRRKEMLDAKAGLI